MKFEEMNESRSVFDNVACFIVGYVIEQTVFWKHWFQRSFQIFQDFSIWVTVSKIT